MTIVGGLRVRLTYDSLFNEIERILDELGWFDAGRQHLPINFVNEPTDPELETPLNTMALVPEDMFDSEIELGSLMSEFRRTFYLDFFGQNQSVSEHIMFDMKDALQGRMSSINRDAPNFELWNYTLATPVVIDTLDIEQVSLKRSNNWTKPWHKNWYSIAFTVVDYYGSEDL